VKSKIGKYPGRQLNAGCKSAGQSEDELIVRSAQSRRRFLGRVGELTTATFASGLLGGSNLAVAAQDEAQRSIDPSDRKARADRALEIRRKAAEAQCTRPLQPQPDNGDEDLYATRIGSFTKALPHNHLGEVEPKAYKAYQRALATCKQSDYELIPMGGTVKLANPQAAMAFDLEGADPHHFSMKEAPQFNSAETAAEMAELYWQALTRDVHFDDYEANDLIKQAAEDLSRFSEFRGPKKGKAVTPATIFRGSTPGDLKGPYISQFLWRKVPYGATTIEQHYRVPLAENDHLVEYDDWLNIQNGAAAEQTNWYDEEPRYLRNARDLGEYVHQDFSYQAYLNAALILMSFGPPALDSYNPYIASATQGGFSTFGGPHILDVVARVANAALKAAWYQKWQVHRRTRPEEFAGRVHNQMTEKSRYDIHQELLDSPVLDLIREAHESYLLPMAYPEGCPTHPAYPAGHATIAGACVTALKAFFNESFVIPNPVTADPEGKSLVSFLGSTLTAGGELNKLASNISIGRDAAGVHWRSDSSEGLKLGEDVALGILKDMKPLCHEQFKGFRLTKFDGTTIII
jgi:hypothetical protein